MPSSSRPPKPPTPTRPPTARSKPDDGDGLEPTPILRVPSTKTARIPERFTTSANISLVGDVNLEASLADVPLDFTLKGMFFARYVDEAWAHVAKQLIAPPTGGKYHAFESYPMADYLRVFDRIARARFPGSTREAYRLLARGEVEVFAETTLGKVTFSMLRDPEVALLRYPELFGVLSKGPIVTAERGGSPRHIVVTVANHVGATEHLLGVLEGLAMTFDVLPSVDVDVEANRRARFVIRWLPP